MADETENQGAPKAGRRKKADPPVADKPIEQRGRYTRAAIEPQNAQKGDAWEDAKGKIRYNYGDGGWYLSPPPGFEPIGADAIPDVDELPRGDGPQEEPEVVDEPLEDEPAGEPISDDTVAQATRYDELPPLQVSEEVADEQEVAVHDAGGPATLDQEDDAEHPGVARIEQLTEEFIPTPEGAVQQLRDLVIEYLKTLDKPYHLLRETAQVDLIRSVEYGCEEVIRGLIEMIAARGQRPVRVLLKKFAAGEKLQITGEVSLLGPDNPDDALLLIHHAIGKHVMLTRATVDDYKQGPEAEIAPDEPEIEFESEDLSEDEEEPDDELADEDPPFGDDSPTD